MLKTIVMLAALIGIVCATAALAQPYGDGAQGQGPGPNSGNHYGGGDGGGRGHK